MKTVVIEDSRLARQGLINMLGDFPLLEVVGEAENVDDALVVIKQQKPELLFLDINMPGKDGFELLASLSTCPFVIFTTAYSDYAIRSFDFNTVDYLLKPFSPERLKKALDKLPAQGEDRKDADDRVDGADMLDIDSQIFIKDREESHLVGLNDISRFESCGNYTQVYFNDSKAFIYKSLSKLEKRLPSRAFFRANRQFIVNLNYVVAVDEDVSNYYQMTLKNGEIISVSRSNSVRLKQLYSL